MPEKKRKVVLNDQGEIVGFETVSGRGRPKKVVEIIHGWLSGRSKEEEKPDEIVLSPDAPLALLYVASFTNFLNRDEMDDNVVRLLKKRGLDAKKVAEDRHTYAMQVQQVRKEIYEEYREEIMSIGNYIIGDTTVGMGSVMAAMSGEKDKRGKNRF